MTLRILAAAIGLTIASAVTPPALSAQASPSAVARAVAPVSAHADVNGTRLHYLRAGTGQTTVVLIHGWPQSSHEWHKVMPDLARRHTVIAVDLRGIGGSAPTAAGYDKANMARDVRDLVRSLGLRNVYVFGHDIGGMVAYAYARSFPGEIAGFGVMDVPLASVEPWAAVKSDPRAWHFAFHQDPGLAEALVGGRQATYFRNFYDRLAVTPGAITAAEERVFAKAYGSPAQLRAGFEWYRAFPQDEAFNAARTEPLRVPMLLVGGDKSLGPMLATMSAGLRKVGVADVRTVQIANSGHWIAEEQPAAVIAAIDGFVSDTRAAAR